MDPHALGIKGSTQPEIFQGTVDRMAQELQTNAAQFWQDALANDGPVEIWVIDGERFLFNGNHRYQAALKAGAEIPDDTIVIKDKTASSVPTYLLQDLTWLPGVK